MRSSPGKTRAPARGASSICALAVEVRRVVGGLEKLKPARASCEADRAREEVRGTARGVSRRTEIAHQRGAERGLVADVQRVDDASLLSRSGRWCRGDVARSAMVGTAVPWKPRSANSSSAASRMASRLSEVWELSSPRPRQMNIIHDRASGRPARVAVFSRAQRRLAQQGASSARENATLRQLRFSDGDAARCNSSRTAAWAGGLCAGTGREPPRGTWSLARAGRSRRRPPARHGRRSRYRRRASRRLDRVDLESARRALTRARGLCDSR